MPTKTYAEILAEFVENLDLKKVPANVVEHAKLCLLDWLGVTMAGAVEREASSLVEVFGGLKPGESTIVGFGIKIPSHEAAYVNGAISHLVELDDIHREAIIHPGAPVIPAGLALSEKLGAPGKTLLESVIAGYEVEIAVGKAVNPSHYKFWHTTGTCGTFGATAAACKVLGLDGSKIVNAFGIAGTHAAGLIEVFGTPSKALNPGRAARDGVLAALLAGKGFTGPRTIFEGEKGFFKATSTEKDYEKGFRELGLTYELTRNGFKRHSSCGHTHAAIDAILALKDELGLSAEDVVEVEVGTYRDALEIVGKNYEPRSPAEAKFSLPYCIAVALIDGSVSLRQFKDERIKDPDVKRLSKKVKVYVDEEVEALYPRKLGAKVRVRTRDGGTYEKLVEVAKGNPENPLSKHEIIGKFMELATLKVKVDVCKRLVETVMNLEKVDNIEKLFEVMSL